MKPDAVLPGFPVIADLSRFDRQSGSALERLVFNHRLVIVLLCLFAALLLGAHAMRIGVNASFGKMIPQNHPYIVNYLANRDDMRDSGNQVRIAVEAKRGTIFDPVYLDTLRRINDDVFLIPGVDRPFMKSLWTPSVRWTAVTEEGLEGGPVIPSSYDGSPASLAQVRGNIERSGQIGQLVAANYRSSLIVVPLLERDSATGQPLDYHRFADALEQVRTKYAASGVTLHITGFAKLMGDLIDGIGILLRFFALSVAIAALALYRHTRCARCTLAVVACSLLAVICLLGLMQWSGRVLDPYSVLVPFLIFAIGMSHGTQKMNGIAQDVGRGTHKLVAARYCFRRLFLPGLTALLCDAVGFAVLMAIPIASIRDLAFAASIGVALLIVTNLILLPVLLSYTGVDTEAARRSVQQESLILQHGFFRALSQLVRPRIAFATIMAATALAVIGLGIGMHLKTGNLNAGAPELRADSRYNRDNAFIVANYAASSDVLIVMVPTPPYRCADVDVLMRVDALEWRLRQLRGVASAQSLAGLARSFMVAMNEGNPKWYDLPRSQDMLHAVAAQAPDVLRNSDCSRQMVYLYLRDHRADTLKRVTHEVETFAAGNDTHEVKFLLAGGNAGIEAATNSVVERFNLPVLGMVYAAVTLLCFVTFRSWRAVLCVLLPLALTSILCQAIMVMLGIGVKVATLPVIALGIGIGVDYGIYVLAMLRAQWRARGELPAAFRATLAFSGRVVVLMGFTLAVAVGCWVFSPIRFQADMGLLLAFMFIWNMIGALVLLPALATFLLEPARDLFRSP